MNVANAANVLLLTKEDCQLCEQARTILERLASEFPLSISTLSVNTPEGRALAEKNGILFAPGLFIDGKGFAYGRLPERKLRRELEARFGRH